MHVSSSAYVGKAVGIGAGIGLIAGVIYDSHCHFVEDKPGCLPIARLVFPVIGSVVGLLGGIAARPMGVPTSKEWIPATFSDRTSAS